MPESDPKSTILTKSIAVLDALGRAAKPMRFTDLVDTAGLSKSSGHRILTALTEQGLIAYDPETRAYRLGFRVMSWALKTWNDFDLQRTASEDMRRLNEATDEHVVLAVLDGTEIVFVNKVESRAPLRMALKVGDRAPVYCTALGKAMVAFLPEPKRRALVERIRFTRFTANTITDPLAFVRELEAIRDQGYAVVDREETDEIRGVAAPIFNFKGDVAGAVNVWAHVFRVDHEKLVGWAPLVIQAAANISRRLGHNG